MRSDLVSSVRLTLLAAVVALLFAAAPPLLAQDEPEPAAEAAPAEEAAEDSPEDSEPYPYSDAYERDTPRGTMRGYLTAGRDNDWERAASYLNLERLPEAERAEAGPRLARELKRVLDRNLWVELEQLSDRPEGDVDDPLADGVDRVGVIETADGDAPIQLRRIRREGEPVWLVSAATVERIDDLYAEFGYGALEDWLPSTFFSWQVWEIQLWQWIALILALLAAWALSWLGAWLVLAVVVPIANRTDTEMDDRLLADGAPPLRFMIGLGIFAFALQWMRLSVPAEGFFEAAVKALTVIAALWFAMRLVDILSEWAKERLQREGQFTAVSLLPIGRRTLKIVFFLLGILVVLQNMGFNVTALVAGLGVGGLAVALAAQKSLENLFGGIMLAVDQPVRVGETVKFGDFLGTVEDIGLRSTRVRTADRTLVSVPNADFSSMQLENLSKRDRMRIILTLGLRYETSGEQLRYALVEIRRMLYAHPRICPDPVRVRFVGFGASSLDVEVFAYVDTDVFDEYLAVREDVYLRIIGIVGDSGSDFAFPSQTLYWERGGGVDDDRKSEIEERVRQWREANELEMPEFRPETVAELAGKLDYPPKGSTVKTEGG